MRDQVGLNERGFNPKCRPLDSGSGAGMTAMERPPSVGTAEGKREKMGPRTREDKGRGKMGPRTREDKEEGEDGSSHSRGQGGRGMGPRTREDKGEGRWVAALVRTKEEGRWVPALARTREEERWVPASARTRRGEGGSPHLRGQGKRKDGPPHPRGQGGGGWFPNRPYGGESDRRGVGRWVPAAVGTTEGGMGWCMYEENGRLHPHLPFS